MAFRESHSCTSLTLNVVIEHKVAFVAACVQLDPAACGSIPMRFHRSRRVRRFRPWSNLSAFLIRRPGLTPVSRKDFLHSFPQRRQDFVFEPGIFPEPRVVPPTWMGQGDSPGETLPPVSNRFGHPSRAFAKVPHERGSADKYRQFEIGHRAQNARLSTCRHTAEVAAGPRQRHCIRENRMPWEGWRNSVDHRTHPPTHRAMRAADPRTGLRTVAPGDGLSPPAPAPR